MLTYKYLIGVFFCIGLLVFTIKQWKKYDLYSNIIKVITLVIGGILFAGAFVAELNK